MELSFETEKLRDICEKRAVAISLFGAQGAQDLERCLADVSAVRSIAEFTDLFPDLIGDGMPGERFLEFAVGQRIVFRPGHIKTPETSGGLIDWPRVTRIRILRFEP